MTKQQVLGRAAHRPRYFKGLAPKEKYSFLWCGSAVIQTLGVFFIT